MNQSRARRTLPSSAPLSKTRMMASWTRRSGSFSSLSPTFTKPTGGPRHGKGRDVLSDGLPTDVLVAIDDAALKAQPTDIRLFFHTALCKALHSELTNC